MEHGDSTTTNSRRGMTYIVTSLEENNMRNPQSVEKINMCLEQGE